MQAYTFGSKEFVKAIIEKGTKEKYTIELNATDFEVFVKILHGLDQFAVASYHDIPVIDGYDENDVIEPLGAWASQMLSSVAESLGIEGI